MSGKIKYNTISITEYTNFLQLSDKDVKNINAKGIKGIKDASVSNIKSPSPTINKTYDKDSIFNNKFFTSEPHFDGNCDPKIGFCDVLAKLEMLNKNLTEGFLLCWTDVSDIHIFDELLDQIKVLSMNLNWYESYLLHPTIHGIFVTKNNNWFIKELYKIFRKEENKYQISTIGMEDFYDKIIPKELCESFKRYELSKDDPDEEKYKLCVSHGGKKSVVLYEFKSKKFAHVFFKYLVEKLSDNFTFSVKNKKNLDILGESISEEYGLKDFFDQEYDIDNYVSDVNKDNEKLYKDNFIHKTLRNKC